MIGSRSRLFVFVAMVIFPAAALAQNARVVTADSVRILDVSFDPPGFTQLNTDSATIGQFVSIALRDDGANGLNLLAADRQHGRVLFYTNAAGVGAIVLDRSNPTAPLRPGALSLDPQKDLFGVSSSVDSQGRSNGKVWVLRHDPACAGGCLPGDYSPTVGWIDTTIDITVPIAGNPTVLRVITLEETRVVPFDRGSLGSGDLLVLSSNPPALLRYPKPAIDAFLATLSQGGVPAELQPEIFVYPSNADVDPARRFPAGAAPNGMEFTPQGNLLVPAGNGTILEYRPDGTRLSDQAGFVDFAAGLGLGKLDLAVGPQNAEFRAVVSDSQNGVVQRFLVGDDGRGTPAGVVNSFVFPISVGTSTANVVPTPAGSNVVVQITDLMHSTIETVDTGGSTSASVVLFEDPRELEDNVPPDEPLHRPLHLSEIRADLPPDAEIPAYVRAFRKGIGINGPPTFVLVVVDNNIHTSGVIDHVVEEAPILGYEPNCDDLDSKMQQRLFWLPSPVEAPILESPQFIDISNDCGTSRGRMRTFSLFLASARDTRSTYEIAQTKLSAIRSVIDYYASCIDASFADVLRQRADTILLLYSRGKASATIDRLTAFSALIQSTPDAFTGCTVNAGGELRARADSAVFILQKLPPRFPLMHD
jgi:hypothetical protein